MSASSLEPTVVLNLPSVYSVRFNSNVTTGKYSGSTPVVGVCIVVSFFPMTKPKKSNRRKLVVVKCWQSSTVGHFQQTTDSAQVKYTKNAIIKFRIYNF